MPVERLSHTPVKFEGRDIMRLRLAHGLTQTRLAEMVGLDQSTLSVIENSDKPIPVHVQIRLLRALIP